ncbi:MAG: dihydrolipoamide acetyltransferase family protein [Pseudomonadota bacterium]
MSDIHPVTIPKWGIEMQEGTVTEWRIAQGEPIEKGEELIDIESDKIVNTMEAPASGVLHRILADIDSTLKVGQLLGVIAPADATAADIDAFIEAFVPADAGFGIDDDEPAAEETAPDTAVAADVSNTPAVPPTPVPSGPVKASPVAKRLAAKLGVDLATVQGTGRGGRISTGDVEAAAAASADAAGAGAPEPADHGAPASAKGGAPAAPTTDEAAKAVTDAAAQAVTDAPADSGSSSADGSDAGEPLSSRELTAARRLVASKQDIPHFYLQRDLDLRTALAAKEREGVPLTALLLKAVGAALEARPRVNAHLVNEARVPQAGVAINVAVDTPEGLVAPLLTGIAEDSVSVVADRLKALAQKARDKQLGKADLAAGGITLSNLGMFGITEFTAIINPPQVAILAVGTLRPLDLGDGPVPAMTATLSCDHRAIDGAEGARFLTALQEALNAL